MSPGDHHRWIRQASWKAVLLLPAPVAGEGEIGQPRWLSFLREQLPLDADAEWVVNRLVGQGVHSLPDDFPAYHHGTLSQYRSMRGPVVESDEYPFAEACARSVTDRIKEDSAERRAA